MDWDLPTAQDGGARGARAVNFLQRTFPGDDVATTSRPRQRRLDDDDVVDDCTPMEKELATARPQLIAEWKSTIERSTPLKTVERYQSEPYWSTLLNMRCMTGGATPLYFAVENGDVELARLLLTAQADVNRPSLDGETPLLASLPQSIGAMTQVLLAAKADVNQPTRDGKMPYDDRYFQNLVAAQLSQPQIANLKRIQHLVKDMKSYESYRGNVSPDAQEKIVKSFESLAPRIPSTTMQPLVTFVEKMVPSPLKKELIRIYNTKRVDAITDSFPAEAEHAARYLANTVGEMLGYPPSKLVYEKPESDQDDARFSRI